MTYAEWKQEVEDRALAGIERFAEASTEYDRRKAVRNGSSNSSQPGK